MKRYLLAVLIFAGCHRCFDYGVTVGDDCKLIEYSISGIGKQPESFEKWNGPSDQWFQVNSWTPPPEGMSDIFGRSGSIGPMKLDDALEYIQKRLQENPMARISQ